MILPIRVFGDPILKERATEVTENTPELQQLIDDMIETMHGAAGIGLAATQVGRRERVFVVDVTPREDEVEGDLPPQPMVLINPELLEAGDDLVDYEEGCLSLPDLNEPVSRPDWIRMRYLDRDFVEHEIEVGDVLARVFQHEYDHLEGILFVDHLSPLRRRLLKRRLREMAKGNAEADYPVSWGD